MITEDYVSFETAKLLKEKWFNSDSGDTSRFYLPNGNVRWKYGHYHDFDIKDRIECPTLQMAMKWLRDKFGIYIEINKNMSFDGWHYSILNQAIIDGDEENGFTTSQVPKHISYEQACEAAIKYCLKNLI